ncbi:MAG: MBL fold metallo-hydrolase [Thiolinea sp.]
MALKIAENWYETRTFSHGVTLIHEPHVASWLRCNIWHVRGRDRDLLIDTGMGLRPFKTELAMLTERPVTAVITHSHFDHSGGLCEFSDRCGHKAEADIVAQPTAQNMVIDTGFVRAETFSALPYENFDYRTYAVKPAPLTRLIDEGDVLDLGDRVFSVLHLPGHSPGSIALYEKSTGLFFSGDTVYDGDLIDDLFHSEADVYIESLLRLKELPVSTVHAGHFGSFDRAGMLQIIDEYMAGGRRLGNINDWVGCEMS